MATECVPNANAPEASLRRRGHANKENAIWNNFKPLMKLPPEDGNFTVADEGLLRKLDLLSAVAVAGE